MNILDVIISIEADTDFIEDEQSQEAMLINIENLKEVLNINQKDLQKYYEKNYI